MTPEAAFFCLVLAGLSVIALVAPFWRPNVHFAAQLHYQRQRDALLVYYQQVTSNLRDLRDDLEAGKLLTEAYETEREVWMGRGVQILRAIDDLDKTAPKPVTSDTTEHTLEVESQIEAAVQRYLDEQKSLANTKG